jgi:hypothetical protein
VCQRTQAFCSFTQCFHLTLGGSFGFCFFH